MSAVSDGTYSWDYTYAGTDQVELITDGADRTFTYGRPGATGLPIIESYTADGNTYAYLYDPQGTPLAVQSSASSATQYLALDGLGSIVAAINHSGVHTATYIYDVWGNRTATDQNNSGVTAYQLYGYTGGVTDIITGYLHLGRRWYNTDTGRFTQRDDINTLADPSRANRYQYAGDNPTNYVDPTGRITGTLSGCIGYGIAVCGGISINSSGELTGTVGAGIGIGGDVQFTGSNDTPTGGSVTFGGCGAALCGGFGLAGGQPVGSAGVGGGAGVFLTGNYSFRIYQF